MKITKNNYGRYFLEIGLDDLINIYKDLNGKYKGATVPIPPGFIKSTPTPLLEDLFAELNKELQKRDRKEVEESLKKLTEDMP